MCKGNNGVVKIFGEQCNIVRSNADLILANSSKATDPATKAGIDAYANIHKAMAIGIMAAFFEQVTLETKTNAGVYQAR